jgi:branched-chain amino acid transport system ATP-binding protein
MLKINDLRFAIGETQILNGVSFNIAAGETVGIIGPNGSGKTTLFNCISGFNIPQSGEITFRGVDITREPPHRRARHGLGRVFQNFGIFKELTLQENVILALESKQTLWDGLFPWSAANKRNKLEATQFLAQVGLAGKKNDRGSTLSGGQMRLLEMIRTLAYGAELFLLDEPTAGVSPKMKEEVEKLINRLCPGRENNPNY